MIHTFLSTSAACLLPVIANSVQTYFMVMTSYNWWRFVLVTVISLVLNQTWIAVYMMVTYATPSNACHAGLIIAILAGFSAGFIIPRDKMPIGSVLALFKCLYNVFPSRGHQSCKVIGTEQSSTRTGFTLSLCFKTSPCAKPFIWRWRGRVV